MKKNVIFQYLNVYAEKEISQAEVVMSIFDNVIVVPAYGEFKSFINFYNSLPEKKLTLIILVINRPEQYEKALSELNEKLFLWAEKVPNNILIVDRHSKPIATKQGVGLARKIGCDISLSLIHSGVVRSKWIYTTDADATLPEDYFSQVKATSGAYLFAFKHKRHKESNQNLAIQKYETYMRDYVRGLKYAGSPYAFHTIGSTLAVHAETYAKVRGFPKKNAGEDFYILNKIAKVDTVTNGVGQAIKLSSRLSSRTPFGTGQSIKTIINQQKSFEYTENQFKALKGLLKLFDTQSKVANFFLDKKYTELSIKDIFRLKCLHFQNKTPANRLKAFHDYFDALKTLKFINSFRKNY